MSAFTTLFNIFLKRTMTDALENHEGSVSTGGRTITNLRFADDIDAPAGKKDELAKLINDMDTTSTKDGMEISAEKTKLTKLKTIRKDKNIALSFKIRLMRSLVITIFLYACETWTLTAELEKKIQTTEMRCFRRLFGISYRDHVTNEKVGNRIRQAIGP